MVNEARKCEEGCEEEDGGKKGELLLAKHEDDERKKVCKICHRRKGVIHFGVRERAGDGGDCVDVQCQKPTHAFLFHAEKKYDGRRHRTTSSLLQPPDHDTRAVESSRIGMNFFVNPPFCSGVVNFPVFNPLTKSLLSKMRAPPFGMLV